MRRFDHLHKKYRETRMKERSDHVLASSRPVVKINGNGTSGYRFKQGPNEGRVVGHISVSHKNSKI